MRVSLNSPRHHLTAASPQLPPPETPNREPRAERPRQERRPRRDEQRQDEPAPAFDPGLLPPSISRSTSDEAAAAPVANVADGEQAPKPRRPRTRRRAEGDDGGETLEAVG